MIFTQEEMSKYNITPWKYLTIEEKSIGADSDISTVGIWDYKENHERFRAVLDGKSDHFAPYFPLFVSPVAFPS